MPFPKETLFFTFVSRRFSSSTAIAKKLPKLRCINEIPPKYKSRALEEAQKAIREYFHATKSLPFVFAELIANNSPLSLSALVSKVRFSTRTFSASLRKLLRYEPINEFEFFLESIGIDYHNVHRFLPRNKSFSQDSTAFGAAFSLSQFGFPWHTLGKLYVEDISIFSSDSDELTDRLRLFKEHYCFDNLSVVGVCLAFPRFLSPEGELGGDVEAIFGDLKRVSRELDGGSCVEGNVDAWYEVCCKVKIFYDLGFEKGKVGELVCENKEDFFRCPKEVLAQKADYFCKFGVGKVDVGLLLLQSPEILNLDLETPVIAVLGLLKHFGLDVNELQRVRKQYPYVFGRNKMANLPHVMRALDLHEWCFDKIKSSNGQLLATYAVGCPDEDIDREFIDALKRVKSSRLARHTMSKVDFLKGIGFGETALTVKVLSRLHGTSCELQERFSFLLRSGIEYSKLCLMIRTATKIIAQSPEKLEQKLNFLCGEMGHSLEYLDNFPEFLFFDLENRIKRRYRCYVWLRESSSRATDYTVGSLIASSEKKFVRFLSKIHPAAPKHYFERF